jgi:hypothetical protein
VVLSGALWGEGCLAEYHDGIVPRGSP